MSALPILAAAAAVQAAAQTGAPVSGNVPSTVSSGPVAGQLNYVDVDASVGYSTNPFLSVGSNSGGGFGRVSVHAVHMRVSERSTTVLSAYGQNVSYFGRYGSRQSVSLTGRHNVALNERVRVFGDLSGSYDQGGQLDTRIITSPEVPPVVVSGGSSPVLIPNAGDFLSITGRTFRVAAHVGGTFALSEHDDLSVTGGAEHVTFRGDGRTNYTSIPGSLAYDRQLSSRTTVGARLAFQNTDYDGPAHYSVITPQLTGRMVLSQRLSLDGAIGVSFANVTDAIRTTHSTGLAAQAHLCWTGQFDSLCAYGSTNEQTATVAGPARSLSAGLSYSRRLGPDSTFNLSAGVDHYSRPISVITGRSFSKSTYYRVAADYSKQINGRLFGGVNASARKVATSGPGAKTDVIASVFIRYHFGDRR